MNGDASFHKAYGKNPLYLRAEIVHPIFLGRGQSRENRKKLRDYFTSGCWVVKLHSIFGVWKPSFMICCWRHFSPAF